MSSTIEPLSSTAGRLAAVDVLELLRVPRKGVVFDLGMPVVQSMPQGDPTEVMGFRLAQTLTPRKAGERDGFEVSVEAVVGCLHTSSHIDALCHVLADGKLYGDIDGEEARRDTGWTVHGAETLPPIVARALLIDIAGSRGVPCVDDDVEITMGEIEGELVAHDQQVHVGDAILIRTGKISKFGSGGTAYGKRAPGLTVEAGVELYDRGMAVLGSDTPGTERLPFRDPGRTLHRALLAERGTALIENLNLEDTHSAGVTEGLFICLAPKIVGATGSWVRPVLLT